jgi:hypothetical protein
MQAVMSVIERYGREHGCWQASHKDWNYKNVNDLWVKMEPILDAKFGGQCSKLEEINHQNESVKHHGRHCTTIWLSDANEFVNSRNKQQETK